jgi:hypothetical protein
MLPLNRFINPIAEVTRLSKMASRSRRRSRLTIRVETFTPLKKIRRKIMDTYWNGGMPQAAVLSIMGVLEGQEAQLQILWRGVPILNWQYPKELKLRQNSERVAIAGYRGLGGWSQPLLGGLTT